MKRIEAYPTLYPDSIGWIHYTTQPNFPTLSKMSASLAPSSIGLANAKYREKHPGGKTTVGMLLPMIPDLARAAEMPSNDLVRIFLNSTGDEWNDHECPLKNRWTDSILRDISHAIGWTDEKAKALGKWCVFLESRPKAGREIGNCYSNARAERLETGNPVYCGLEGMIFGNSIYWTPHAFNYDPKTEKFYDTDTPRSMKRMPCRMALIFMDAKESWNYLRSEYHCDGKVKEDFAQTRGQWMMMRISDTKIAVARYSTKHITRADEVSTLVKSDFYEFKEATE